MNISYQDLYAKASDSEYQFREIDGYDLMRGYYETLRPFLDKGEEQRIESYEHFAALVRDLKAYKHLHKVIVVEDKHSASESERIVGTGSILVKPDWKTGTLNGYITDMGVKKEHQESRLAQRILNLLQDVAKAAGCDRVILETYTEAVKFYEKRGFKRERQFLVYNTAMHDSTIQRMEKLRNATKDGNEEHANGTTTPRSRLSQNTIGKSPRAGRDEEFSFKTSTISTQPSPPREI
jgi:ribosomal protein S18 acetylase RimI-like enzyme